MTATIERCTVCFITAVQKLGIFARDPRSFKINCLERAKIRCDCRTAVKVRLNAGMAASGASLPFLMVFVTVCPRRFEPFADGKQAADFDHEPKGRSPRRIRACGIS